MKKLLALCALALCVVWSFPTRAALEAEAKPAPGGPAEMLGTYVGPFGHNKITIWLKKIDGGTLRGVTIVAGNERPFAGPIVEKDGAFEVTAPEPGDNPEDGVFTFRLQSGAQTLTGTWTPNDLKKLDKKTFDLPRREFRYDPAVGDFPQSSARLLKKKDVENLPPDELRIMRNEIYARHGYSFRIRDMRTYFDMQDWYMPISTDIQAKLTDIEKKNHELIKRFEKYAADHYDEFGR